MRQRRWIELLSDYDCEIRYHPGKANVVADALSRKDKEPIHVRALVVTVHNNLPGQIRNAQARACEKENISAEGFVGEGEPFEVRADGTKCIRGRRRWIELLSDYDCEICYHPGKANVVADALSRKDKEPIRVRALDFITKLPRTQSGYDSIWVIVDRLTKFAHFIPVNEKFKTKKLARLYLKEIVWTSVDISTAYHPQTDGQSERMIQTLKDMLRVCVIDFGNGWDKHLPLAEFSYNNSYHASIKAAPFEALYGRKCRSLLCWSEVGDAQLTGPELIRETTEMIVQIKNQFNGVHIDPAKVEAIRNWSVPTTPMEKELNMRQRRWIELLSEYDCEIHYHPGDMVMLKVSPWKGIIRFGKLGKLSPRYIGPFEIIKRIGPVAYKLELAEKLRGIHNTFHVLNLKKCLADENLVISLEEIQLGDKLHLIEEPMEIMDREVKQLKQIRIPIVKVRWNLRRCPKYTWEREDFSKRNYPHLFSSHQKTYKRNQALGRGSRKEGRM
nr:putative reverse transcriptase domain-containing protein [Tanacetum cinerariifolium]